MATTIDSVIRKRSTRVAPRSLSRRLLVLLALFAIIATACGGGDTTDVAAEAADQGGSTALLEGSFETFSGETVDLSTLQNTDAVFWFWAPF